jgi:hypothetical protein
MIGYVHELAHEPLHHGEDRPASKAVREMEAVAFVASHGIGLDAGSAAREYIHLIDVKTDTLAALPDRILRTSDDITAALRAPEEREHSA